MADFEGLINQALAKQDSSDPSVRERVYQSSRNALVKMLEKTGIVSDDAVRLHFENLENSISKIEAGYQTPAIAEPQSEKPIPEAVQAEPIQPQGPPPETMTTPSLVERPLEAELPKPVASSVEENAYEQQIEEIASEPEPAEVSAIAEEPDIIDELEALLSPSYKPAPLFPSVAPTNSQGQQPLAQTAPAPSSQPEPAVPISTTSAVPSTPATPPQIVKPEPPKPVTPFPTANSQPPATAQVQRNANRPTEPSFEDEFKIPDRVEAHLGDARTEEIFPESFDDEQPREPVHVYKRKNPLLRRIWPIFLALGVVLVILWILYALLANMPKDNGAQNAGISVGPVGESQVAEDGSVFITLLEPTDLSALVTAGRGSAELISQQNQQVLRLQSVRQGALTASGAEPILLELEKGVLNQITGKTVTVELYAKSGQNGPAQFAVECDFAGDSICGRKRFRVGTQPERIVFALDLTAGIKPGERAYLAVNTDITNSADASGNGDAIDVIYVRLRLSTE